MQRIFLAMMLASVACLLAINQITVPGKAEHQNNDDEAQVMKADEEFRVAKLKNDTGTLDRILADNFYETNQNGNSRNKAQFIELFTRFEITSLTTDESQVQVTDNTAVVIGSQTETIYTGVDRMLFTRVYVKRQNSWQLLASTQFNNPKQTS